MAVACFVMLLTWATPRALGQEPPEALGSAQLPAPPAGRVALAARIEALEFEAVELELAGRVPHYARKRGWAKGIIGLGALSVAVGGAFLFHVLLAPSDRDQDTEGLGPTLEDPTIVRWTVPMMVGGAGAVMAGIIALGVVRRNNSQRARIQELRLERALLLRELKRRSPPRVEPSWTPVLSSRAVALQLSLAF